MLVSLRSHMSVMCWAGCLGSAVFANIRKARPGTHSAHSPSVSDPGPAQPVDCTDCWWWRWDQDIMMRWWLWDQDIMMKWWLQVCPGSVLSSSAPHDPSLGSGSVTCCLWPAWPARPELVNVRELGQWQRAKWNDTNKTQVAKYFFNPATGRSRILDNYNTCIYIS